MTAGAASAGSDSGRAVGLLGGQEERELPVTLPEVVEDEEQEGDSDPYSTWHALYGTDALTEVYIYSTASVSGFKMEKSYVKGIRWRIYRGLFVNAGAEVTLEKDSWLLSHILRSRYWNVGFGRPPT